MFQRLSSLSLLILLLFLFGCENATSKINDFGDPLSHQIIGEWEGVSFIIYSDSSGVKKTIDDFGLYFDLDISEDSVGTIDYPYLLQGKVPYQLVDDSITLDFFGPNSNVECEVKVKDDTMYWYLKNEITHDNECFVFKKTSFDQKTKEVIYLYGVNTELITKDWYLAKEKLKQDWQSLDSIDFDIAPHFSIVDNLNTIGLIDKNSTVIGLSSINNGGITILGTEYKIYSLSKHTLTLIVKGEITKVVTYFDRESE